MFKVIQLAELGPEPKSHDSWSSSQVKNPVLFWLREHQSKIGFCFLFFLVWVTVWFLSLELVSRRLSVANNSGLWKHCVKYRCIYQAVGR